MLGYIADNYAIDPDDNSDGLIFQYRSDKPSEFHKISGSYLFGDNQSIIKTGFVLNKQMGQDINLANEKKFLELAYIPILNSKFQIDRVVLGNLLLHLVKELFLKVLITLVLEEQAMVLQRETMGLRLI